jgi:2-amino-4-hydroxy-6-hydroxymethyldihydropteridine diphosphokinase
VGVDPPGRVGYLGLGSNVGERRDHLQAALDALRARGLEVLASSSVYETEPVGLITDQREFFNACLRIATPLAPEQLLDLCKSVERDAGRDGSGPRHGPRVIDVDVLLLGDQTHRSPRLSLPHSDISTRRFVLVPLLELDPELRFPDGSPVAGALAALGAGQEVRRAGPPLV